MNTRIKNTSKAGQRKAREAATWAYSHPGSTYKSIFEAYKNPSSAKVAAWFYCQNLCEQLHGYDLIVTAAGCFTFSVFFKFRERGTRRECYAYITRDYNRFCYAQDIPEAETKTVMQMTAAA